MKFLSWINNRPKSARRLIFASPVLLLGLLWFAWGAGGDVHNALPVTTVIRGPMRISLIENGTIRPRQQVVIRNETNRTVSITKIVSEGAHVKKGEMLLEFDDTDMMNSLVERRIRVQNSESGLIAAEEELNSTRLQTKSDIESAKLAAAFAQQDLEKFIEGEDPQKIKALQTKITLSQEDNSLAKEKLRWSQILFDEKYLSQSDLQRDELSFKKSQLNLELAQEDLRLYQNYTRNRDLAELRSRVDQTKIALERTQSRSTGRIAQFEARYRASEASNREEIARLKREESEATKFFVRAPISGMALYASSVDNRWRGDPIEVGLVVRPNTEIIYLPTADDYDVDILVPEVSLNKLAIGLPAIIKIDALPKETFTGKLSAISVLPDGSSRWLNPNLKLYKTSIQLDPVAESALRNGMSCQVEILVEDIADTLQLPLQTVVRENEKPVVYVFENGKLRAQPVTIGRDNNRMVQILSGLTEGQSVVLTPPLQQGGADESHATD